MVIETSDNILHKLDNGYQITKTPGRPNTLVLRDQYCTKLVVLELFQDKIIGISGYHEKSCPLKYTNVIINFVRGFHYLMSNDVAIDLGLSIIKTEDSEEMYFTKSELNVIRLNKFMRNVLKTNIILNGWKRSKLIIPKGSQNCTLNLSHAQIKKIVVSKHANVLIDLKNNQTIDNIIVEDGFIGSLNLSRSSVSNIKVGNNCRCNISMNYSAKCFDLSIGDVYSGLLDVTDSCFHNLKIGYYCYANIKLSENWGQKNIIVGDSFRGNLVVDSVYVKNISIGNDCRGKIFVKSKDRNERGIKHINLADDFGGELDIADSKTVERVDIGNNASGHVNLSGCDSVKSLKFDECFDGVADLSHSSIMYIRAQKGSYGHFVLMNCSNLTLLKLSRDGSPTINIDKSPLEIAKDEKNIYYRYHHGEVPQEFITLSYIHWYKSAKNFFKRHFSRSQ